MDPEVKQGRRQGCYMGNSLSSASHFCWSMGLTCCFAGESTTVQKPRTTTALSPCEDIEEVQYEQRPCIPCLDELSVKSTDRVLTGSVRSLQEHGHQSWLAWGKGHLPGERDLCGEGQSRVWCGPDDHNASSVPAAELQGQPSGAC